MSVSNPSIQAGRFRRRVDIQRPVTGVDSAGGPLVDRWVPLHTRVPAAIEPITGREYFLARQVQSDVTVSILIRHRPGVTSACRVVHYTSACGSPRPAEIYNIEAVLPDPTGRRYLTLLCRVRAEEGFRTDGQ